MRLWLCLYLPWHHWRHLRWLSQRSELAECSCGRRYAVNHEARGVLPFDAEVEAFYADLGRWP